MDSLERPIPEEYPYDDEIDEGQVKEVEEAPIRPKYSITSYGVDYPVDSLVKRIADEALFVPPFQRDYVWTLRRASRFIESLLLGLPVPGIFISKEKETNKLLIIDGQQRLLTLSYFYGGVFEPLQRTFALIDVDPRFEGKSYRELLAADRRTLDDAVIHATVVKPEDADTGKNVDYDSSIYEIFERLNTGGVLLSPQEIRACIFHGPFNRMLEDLNSKPEWRAIYGPLSNRKRDQELILRFLALFYRHEQYVKPMKEFLNNFMQSYRSADETNIGAFSELFLETMGAVNRAIGKGAFRPSKSLNAAVFDSVMVGLAKRIQKAEMRDSNSIHIVYENLLANKEYRKATDIATTDEEQVKKRITMAIAEFDGVR